MTSKNNSNFMIRRLHSLLAIIPIGIFVVVHFLLNSTMFINGSESYVQLIEFMKSSNIILAMEIVIIAIPIIFHALYGIYIVYLSKNNTLTYKYARNWGFYLQRITAVICLIFILVHIFTLRLSVHEPNAVVNAIVTQMQNPLWVAFYVIGIIASLYHLSNGLFTFCITWGICAGDKAQKIFHALSLLVFAALSVWAVAMIYKLTTMAIL